MHEWGLLIAAIFFCLLGNGFFSGSEIALLSAKRGQIEALITKGNHRAARVKRLQDDPDTLLATVQIGVTFMHVGLTTAMMAPTVRLVLATGVMGGFTTYSTFNYETLEYLREGAFGIAALNVAVTLVVCLAAGALGLALARWLVGS